MLNWGRLTYLKKGVSISTDGRQIGQAFIEKCDDKFCEATVDLAPEILFRLTTANAATFEYQVTDAESIALAVKMDQLLPALAVLQKAVGLTSPAEPGNTTFVVQLRTNPSQMTYGSVGDKTFETWGTPLNHCNGAPAEQEVSVTPNLKIQNSRGFIKWVATTKSCASNSVFWIIQKPKTPEQTYISQTTLDITKSYAVYDVLKDNVPNFVGAYVNDAGPVQLSR